MPPPIRAPLLALRADKWLWAARFFKTRSLAAEAIRAGHVKLNGNAIKVAREVRAGNQLEIMAGDVWWTVDVLGLNDQRRPASEAQQLYEETSESRTRREARKDASRLAPVPGSDLRGRPTKKARRQIHRFNEGH
ncbi:RNA-binding S4 domain-containing protein [Propionivibrio soli]|uniref:RNA-binding S4 domain-containing protein n=1 Tax=Propionivibrio soli TaxID=2976531 RepID=UPI0021E7A360|nr:RNA-binding S4 domain-containing protein [Propionivibrio soli]